MSSNLEPILILPDHPVKPQSYGAPAAPHGAATTRALYGSETYSEIVTTKTERWNLRVTPAQDAVVRKVLDESGESLNDFVVRHAVQAARDDLADHRVFVVEDDAWNELQQLLARPPVSKPALTKLLANPSVLEPPS